MALISKEDHQAGKTSVMLSTRWGEPVGVELRSPTWREMRALSSRSVAENLSAADWTSELVLLCLPEAEKPKLDVLDVRSVAELQRYAIAFALGEASLKPKPPAESNPS